MKQTLTTSHAADLLRSDENAAWSWNGAYALCEWLEEMEEGSETEMEFDRVAIRCDFSEYESLQEWAAGYWGSAEAARKELYNGDSDIYSDSDIFDEFIREHIQDNGTLIEFEGGVIVSSF